ncbi:uncharacterized protein LOC143500204 [Brachyhypopomus gauderio]|uniref:uncharacterized protein LOC143500204 n=1 Tax=Brachyhypopomus gauderio TaxID=698409 RepID=UPI0040421AC6
MEQPLYSRFQTDLQNWCKGEELDIHHAMLVVGVGDDDSISQIEEVLHTVCCWGRVRVRGKTFDAETNSLVALCECREQLNTLSVPPEVRPPNGSSPWKIVTIHPAHATSDEFSEKLQKFLLAEGKRIEDLQFFCRPPSPKDSAVESLARVMGEFMSQSLKAPSENHHYRRLRPFSGTTPTPAGEEQLEPWIEQATLLIEESDCSEKEKRRRVFENLKGPAFEIVRALRFTNPDAQAEEYLEAINRAFGSTESGEDLYFSFRLMQQKTGEKLSDFVRRLEPLLARVVQKGGLRARDMDRVRVEQLLRGALGADLMLLQLRLKERRNNPPTFLDLLSEIRAEEEYERSRHKICPRVRQVNTQENADSDSVTIQHLKTELKRLKEQIAGWAERPVRNADDPQPSLSTVFQSDSEDSSAEVVALQKQFSRMKQKVKNVQAETRNPVMIAANAQVAMTKNPTSTETQQVKGRDGDYFCYRCGGDGHIATKCTLPENEKRVIQKLIASLRRAKDKQSAKSEQTRKAHACSVREYTANTMNITSVPEGLIGPSPTVTLQINGQPCSALLDSGSQVTIIFEDWYNQYLSYVPIQQVSGLAIWGLSESSYPYKGYVVVDVQFPKEFTGSIETLSVLALICPGPKTPDQTPVILGTNASLFRRLASLCNLNSSSMFAQALGINCKPINNELTSLKEESENPEEVVGFVKWEGPGHLVIPPLNSCRVQCRVDLHGSLPKGTLLIEANEAEPLPQGLLLQPVVAPTSAVDVNSFSVLLQNESMKEITVHEGKPIGQVQITDVAAPSLGSEAPESIDPRLIDFGDSPLPNEWKERLRRKLCNRRQVFSLHEWEVGLAKGVEHNIRLSDPRPFRERSRRIAYADIEDVRKHLQDLLAAGIIKESRSPYASPIVIARKKNGNIRMCIDYRTLNSKTVPDQYTTPRIDDALDCLSGSRWFSVLDLRSGYYQIAMSEQDQEKTAFICPLGFYQFQRMPQGITGAPATFQRLMEKAVGDMNLLQVLVYLDDLIIFGATLEEHEERLFRVLDRLEEVGLKISLDKCHFCQSKVKYVGHIISAEGIAADPDKIETVTQWPQPTDLKSLRSFLGFCGYYRRFIAGYSSIVRPLTDLTKGYPPNHSRKGTHPKRDGGKSKPPMYFRESEPFGDRWTDACTTAFCEIISCLTSAPVLAFADPNKPYVLHVDASLSGLGAVLNQEHPEGLRPVAFASRGLSAAEQNYHIHQLEFLALKWAVVDKFHDYLYGVRFSVRTDNNPLTYVLSSARLNATGHRWLAALATYDFEIQYRPGKSNIDADLLSRKEEKDHAEPWKEISQTEVKAICKCANVQTQPDKTGCLAENLGVPSDGIPLLYAFPTQLELGQLPQLTMEDLRKAQTDDAVIREVIGFTRSGQWPAGIPNMHPELVLMKRHSTKLIEKNGLMYRVTQKNPGGEIHQLLLPEKFRRQVIKSLHDDMGHLGVDRTLDLVRSRFYWPRMSQTVEQYVKNCGNCVSWKSPCVRAAPLNQIVTNGPMELVCIDFLCLEPDSKGFANILVVTDHFSRYAQAFPTKDQRAVTVAKVLVEKFFVHYGLPSRIHSDQGRDFESKLIHELLRVLGVRKSRTTPYRPQGDPQPERFNRTLLSMLGTLESAQKRQWSQHVTQLVHAYNSTKNDSTGYSPYYLMFGREARLPVDICFGAEEREGVSHSRYVEELRKDLQSAYELAKKASNQVHLRNKRNYEKLLRPQVLDTGDRVLLKNLGLKGKHKLQSRWSSFPYVVVGKIPDLPVYRIKPESGMGREKTMHRDHLLPIGCLVRLADENTIMPATRPATRQTQAAHLKKKPNLISLETTELGTEEPFSDSDDEIEFQYFRRVEEEPSTTSMDGETNNPSRSGQIIEDHLVEGEMIALQEGNVEDLQDVVLEHDEPQDEDVVHEIFPVQDQEIRVHEPLNPRAQTEISSIKREKRQVKPVIRLTYDEFGKPTDQPITIVHRGVVIKIG